MTHQAHRNQSGTKIVIAGSTPAVLQAALSLAQVNLAVELWVDHAAHAAHTAWPLTAAADPEKALAKLYQAAAEVVHSKALQSVDVAPGKTYFWQPGGLIQLPEPQLAGITAAALAPQMQQLLGWPASIRAYCDRLLPVLNIGKVKSLATLVTKRQGATAAVLPELVNRARTGQALAELKTAAVVPHLNEGLTKTGSLSGAIAWLAADRPALSYPQQGAVAARDAVLRALQYYGVTVQFGQAPADAYDTAALLRLAAGEETEYAAGAPTADDAALHGTAETAPAPAAGASAPAALAAPVAPVTAAAVGSSVLATLADTLAVQPGDEIVLPLTAAGEVIALRDKQRPALADTRVVHARVLHPAEVAALHQAELYQALPAAAENNGQVAVLSLHHADTQPGSGAEVLRQAAAQLGAAVATEFQEFVLADPQWQHAAVQELHEMQLALKPLRRKLLGFEA